MKPSHHGENGGFVNPWPAVAQSSTFRFPISWLSSQSPSKPFKSVKPEWLKASKGSRAITFLSHSSSLLEFLVPGSTASEKGKGKADAFAESQQFDEEGSEERIIRILFDPIISLRAGPSRSGVIVGPKRLNAAPYTVDELPGVDFVVISHNHYDHLDLTTIQLIYAKFPLVKFLVPMGNKAWFIDSGFPAEVIFEKDWHESTDFDLFNLSEISPPSDLGLRFTCVPAQHNSGRSLTDYGATLWCGWVVKFWNTKVFFAGDTGYCPAFKELGEKFGGFDLSLIPIWRGGTLSGLNYALSFLGLQLANLANHLHASPADAVKIHIDVKSRLSIPIHFDTFVGCREESLQALALSEAEGQNNTFSSIDSGQTVYF